VVITSLSVGDRTLTWGVRTYLMGILNITPDSFSGDGVLAVQSQGKAQVDFTRAAIEKAHTFISAGVDILDVGGESTRPGSQPVPADEEKHRVLPVIRELHKKFPHVLISVDTSKAVVAEASLEAGAHMVNDVWGLRNDVLLAGVVAGSKAPVILMHNRSRTEKLELHGTLGKAYTGSEYVDLLEDVKRELMQSVVLARSAGIPDECIILDPGLGFGKTVLQNLELINRLDEIRSLGFPVLIGPSRKSFIGFTLNLPASQRLEGTAAAVAVGIVRGADIVRVHDVETMCRVARMTDAIVRPKQPS
jgi:dihydropteroate synthase